MYQRITRRLLAVVMLTLLITLGVGFAAPAPADAGVRWKGNTHASLGCTETGVKWSGVTRNFRPKAKITYRWEIYMNGKLLITGSRGGFTTDRRGDHIRLPSGFPQALDCGSAIYMIVMWTTTSGYRTDSGIDTATC